MKTVLERFEEKYTKGGASDCWLWLKPHKVTGYGSFWFEKRTHRAHRIAYFLYTGVWPGKLHVCHTCDTPSCVNPKHLFLGTQQNNIQDMADKGRSKTPKGGTAPLAKLTDEQAMAIYSDPRTGKEIAADYGICFSNVYTIKRRETFKNIHEV